MPTNAVVYLSCPNGCFTLEVSAYHEIGAADDLIDKSVQDNPGPCPKCHADIDPEVADG